MAIIIYNQFSHNNKQQKMWIDNIECINKSRGITMNEKEAIKTLKDSGLKVIKEYADTYTNDTYDQLFETIYDMSAEECARHLLEALRKRRNSVTLTGLGKATVAAHNLFPNLTDKLTYSYISREKDSPFK